VGALQVAGEWAVASSPGWRTLIDIRTELTDGSIITCNRWSDGVRGIGPAGGQPVNGMRLRVQSDPDVVLMTRLSVGQEG
jgi:hypothetical protein